LQEKYLLLYYSIREEYKIDYLVLDFMTCENRKLLNTGVIIKELIRVSRDAIKLITKVIPRFYYCIRL